VPAILIIVGLEEEKIYTKNCFLVTGAFFSPSGIQHSNYTEILLPDIIAEAWATLSKV
jgi:hypothetical protein